MVDFSKFESIRDFEIAAEKILSKSNFDFVAGGSENERTIQKNQDSLKKKYIRPRYLRNVLKVNTSCELTGRALSMPILIAPIGIQGLVHPDGDLATAAAAKSLGLGYVHSTVASQTMEDVARILDHSSPSWFQLYFFKDREITQSLVQRAEKAGYAGICVTVDMPTIGTRSGGKLRFPKMKPPLQFRNLVQYLTPDELKSLGDDQNVFRFLVKRAGSRELGWKDIEWLQSISSLPVIIKGILHYDDALEAVRRGIKTIVVSNHGGRQLDGTMASIDALVEIKSAVKDDLTLIFDSGIRCGSDIFKALALGASSVTVCRPILWGLTVGGEAGVKKVLEILCAEFMHTMALAGCEKLGDLNQTLIWE